MTLQDLTGQIFGQYELRQLIGVGGMGAVYRGFQANLEREVAIKVLSTALASETGYIERFYREAKTAAALEHAHIVPVYDYGIQRDISYVIMRLLAGGTLAERVRFCLERERSLPAPSEVGELLRQVASALDYAHSQGVIHRDIKPSNIMFDNQGNAYLVDFGIAKLMEATSSLTGTGVAMGTPIYMPPEQWRSENLAPAADQYALAATVYGLLTGRAPYEASTPFGLMHKHLNETPTPVHLRRPGLPESVSAVLERALAKASGDRFATVTAFAQAYTSAIAGSEGKPTGFFTVKLPESARQEGPPRTPSSPRPPTPSSGGAPRGAPPPSEPSLPAMPTGAGKPIHRSPVVWALALGLVAALAVIGFLVLGQGGDGGAGTPAPGDLTGTALAAVPTPTETPTVPALVTATPLPSKTPEPTATPEPTETVTATDTVTATATDTLQPTETPTVAVGLIVLSPTYTPSDTPAPTDTLTPTRTPRPTATPWPTRTPTKTPRPTATPWPTRTPTLAWEPVFAVVKTTSASIRPVPKPTAGELGQVGQGTRMPVTGRTANGQYVRVEYRGREGWMFFSFVEIEGDLGSVPVIEAETEGVLALVGPRAVIIYVAPDLYAARIETVENVELLITGRTANGQWYRVEWQGREAWIVNSYYLRTQGDKSTIPVVEVEAEEVAPTLTAANTFLGVILQADFSGPISEFSTAAEGWYVSRTWGNPEICVQAPSDTSRRLVLDMPATLGDYLVETEVRFVSPFGRLALLTRLDSSGAGYRHEMELTPTDRTVRQYYYPPSGDLGSLSGYAKTATQHILRAEVQGDTIRTYLDGRLVGAATDPNRSAGSVAFEVGPNTHVCIFQLTVRSLHSSPEAMRNAQITEAIRDANLRSGPGTDYRIVGEVSAGDRLFIMEWSLDRSWAYVRTDRDHSHAWIWTELIREQ